MLQEEMKTRHFLWQAYHTEQDMGEAGKDVTMHQQALAAAEAELKIREAEVEGKKKEAAGLAKERLLLEKSIKKKRGEAEKKVRQSLVDTRNTYCFITLLPTATTHIPSFFPFFYSITEPRHDQGQGANFPRLPPPESHRTRTRSRP
jgi:hypothetical protein